ncbi:uncharacterized protein TNCV_1013191 [Trichonephila clavipes]|uniref:Transposase n=1 Tax=Trichonephila clavipes TaxID=2585209 RepID=A0A8X7B9I6_TRICX|nr:uncharacterized protein TNCV_1013191 [Trichonephila clavipes]
MNCQTKLRINHLTAVKSIAILESNANLKLLYLKKKHSVVAIGMAINQTRRVAKRMWGFGASYFRKYIGRGGPVDWSLHSPDLSPLEFFWGHLKSVVYEALVAVVEDLTVQIYEALADIDITRNLFESDRQSFLRRCRLCYNLHSRNFEQFL